MEEDASISKPSEFEGFNEEVSKLTNALAGTEGSNPVSSVLTKRKGTSFKIINVLPSRPPSNDAESGEDDVDDSRTEETSEYSSVSDQAGGNVMTTNGANGALVSKRKMSTDVPIVENPMAVPKSDIPVLQVSTNGCCVPITTTSVPVTGDIVHGPRDRFKVVKLDTDQPIKRGRWTCLDIADKNNTKFLWSNFQKSGSVKEIVNGPLDSCLEHHESDASKTTVSMEQADLGPAPVSAVSSRIAYATIPQTRNEMHSIIVSHPPILSSCNEIYPSTASVMAASINITPSTISQAMPPLLSPSNATGNILYSQNSIIVPQQPGHCLITDGPNCLNIASVPPVAAVSHSIQQYSSLVGNTSNVPPLQQLHYAGNGVGGYQPVWSTIGSVVSSQLQYTTQSTQIEGSVSNTSQLGPLQMPSISSAPITAYSISAPPNVHPTHMSSIDNEHFVERLVEISALPLTEFDGESSSGSNQGAIDSRIEQAMDLVKSHLMNAVRHEVEELKEKIVRLEDSMNNLQHENDFLKANVTNDVLNQLPQYRASIGPTVPQAAAMPSTPTIQTRPPQLASVQAANMRI